jgi:hypothetical protein
MGQVIITYLFQRFTLFTCQMGFDKWRNGSPSWQGVSTTGGSSGAKKT